MSSYLEDALDPKIRKKHINRLYKQLKPVRRQFDAIACRGLSGLLVAPVLADMLGKPLIVLRSYESSHSNDMVETLVYTKTSSPRYVIVDDFVASGRTVRKIRKAVAGRLVGLFMYRHSYEGDFEGKPFNTVWKED